MTRPLDALAILDRSTPQQLANDVLTYRALAMSALDSLAQLYAENQLLQARYDAARSDLRRLTAAVTAPGVVPEAVE